MLDIYGSNEGGVVSVIGRDQKGIVARISTYLAAHDINIEDIEQRVVEGLFIMSMRVDLTEGEGGFRVNSGISAGARIVTAGIHSLKQGQKVRIEQDTKP